MRNIWGKTWTIISGFIILVAVVSLAIVKHCGLQPDSNKANEYNSKADTVIVNGR
ncbi:MAG: hypothetical protein GXO48_00540 [Chlorobi bacterium]|nr:hypothetical protein [Chlorobiota bacterium]